MDIQNEKTEAIELLQQLGLKEYEAKCFVALSRLPQATAKEISEVSDVPRTRVYDAVQVLESKGLVEAQHSNPQQFRGVPVEEATETLIQKFKSCTEELEAAIEEIDPASVGDESHEEHEVWTMADKSAIEARAKRFLDRADDEAIIVVGELRYVTDSLLDAVESAHDRGVEIFVGVSSPENLDQLQGDITCVNAFLSPLQWLNKGAADDGVTVSRLLLVDREDILVSTHHEGAEPPDERAVIGCGFKNGFVTVLRRLLLADENISA